MADMSEDISKIIKNMMNDSLAPKDGDIEKKKTKIMERNIEFIKKVEKTGNLYGNIKDYVKRTPNSESKNCRKFMENPQPYNLHHK